VIYDDEYSALCRREAEELRELSLSAVQRDRLERFLIAPPESLAARVAGSAFLAGAER
jgi:hypothetical protein